MRIHRTLKIPCFNSLQTGRCFRTPAPGSPKSITESSFNSLQTGKHFRTSILPIFHPLFLLCFNSLQTGRCFRTRISLFTLQGFCTFQFPPNRKAFPNFHPLFFSVSIPFKQESVSKLPPSNLPSSPSFRFNSLQTGRYFRTL